MFKHLDSVCKYSIFMFTLLLHTCLMVSHLVSLSALTSSPAGALAVIGRYTLEHMLKPGCVCLSHRHTHKHRSCLFISAAFSSLTWSVSQCCCHLPLSPLLTTQFLSVSYRLTSSSVEQVLKQWKEGDASCITLLLPLLSFMPSPLLFVSFCLQVNCNGFTIEDEELSHLGSAIFPE